MKSVRAAWETVVVTFHKLVQWFEAREKLRAGLGYTLAALTIPLMMITVLSLESGIDEAIVRATGLTIAPGINGGLVVQTIEHGPYQTLVHETVFDALIGERREGFVQVAWTPADALPARIEEEIDANGDGQADFLIEVHTESKQAALTPYADWVLDLEGVYEITDAVAIRVNLKNTSR